MRGQEAVGIIDRNAAFVTKADVSWWRTAAAINAERPLAALGSATIAVRIAEELRRDGKPPENLATIARIRQTLSDPRPFQSLPRWKYREVLKSLNRTLSVDSQ